MKKILLCAIALVFSCTISSQELLDSWTLHYMIINGTTIDVPQPGPPNILYHPKIEFFESNDGYEALASIHQDTNYFRDWSPPMTIEADTFTFQDAGSTLGDCSPYCELEGNYFGTILGSGTRTFDYEITTDSNGDRTLVITNEEGNIAVYGDFILGAQDLINPKISLFPNPVQDILNFSVEALSIANLKIYSISGAEVFFSDLAGMNQINVSFLNDGLYFFQLSDTAGKIHIQKFIKQ